MNRRSFLDSVIKAGISCSILPAAVTYARNWNGIFIPQPMVRVTKRCDSVLLWEYKFRYLSRQDAYQRFDNLKNEPLEYGEAIRFTYSNLSDEQLNQYRPSFRSRWRINNDNFSYIECSELQIGKRDDDIF